MNHHQDFQIQNPDQFQGYIQRTVKDIDQTLEELNEKITGCSRQIASLRWKVAGIGGTVAVIVSLVMSLLNGFFQHLIKK